MAPLNKAPTPAVQAKKPAAVPRRAKASAAKAPAPEDDEPEAPPAQPVGFFLIGETKAAAAAVAEHEWGWAKTKTGWTDRNGNAVKFLEDYGAVLKASADTPIWLYEGYRWYAAIPPHMLDRLVADKRVVKLPTPVVDSPA